MAKNQIRSKRLNEDGLKYHGSNIRDWIKNCVAAAGIYEAKREAGRLDITARNALKDALKMLKDNLPGNISKALKKKLIDSIDTSIKKLPKKIARNTVLATEHVIKRIIELLPDKSKEKGEMALFEALESIKGNVRQNIKRIKNKQSYSKTELWIFVLFIIVDWYIGHEKSGEPFFWKYSTIRKYLESCGYECTNDGIEEALRVLKDMDLIQVVYPRNDDGTIMSKVEWEKLGHNPNKYVFRTIYINWNVLYPYLAIFTKNQKIMNKGKEEALKNKSRFKKLVYKRPMSVVTDKVFEYAMRDAGYETYKNKDNMFFGFVAAYSSKYYNPVKFTKGKRPDHIINLQKEQDAKVEAMFKQELEELRASKASSIEAKLPNSIAYLEDAYRQAGIYGNRETPDVVKEFLNAIK